MQLEMIFSEPHYQDHMWPIWQALPDELKGKVHKQRDHVYPPEPGNVALIAGWQDLSLMPDGTKVFYVEHGAGQVYTGDPKGAWRPGYSAGGRLHRGVVGYICPSQTVADRWGKVPAVAVGCPKMDPFMWLREEGAINSQPTAAFAFHWDAKVVCPEARTAYWHYAKALPAVTERWKAAGWKVIGHAHPRWRGALDDILESAGMDVWRGLTAVDQIFGCADILFVDNSSLAYEFASLDRTVVSLNAPWYRRDVEHGLRFWSHIPGPWVDWPVELVETTPDFWIETDEVDSRKRAVEHAYAFTDGKAGPRAAAWIAQRMAEL